MKVVKSEQGPEVIEDIFKKLQNQQSELIIWQMEASKGERIVSLSRLQSYDLSSRKIRLEFETDSLARDLLVYCFSKEDRIIFKSKILEMSDRVLGLEFPQEVKFLDPSVELSEIWKVNLFKPRGAQNIINEEFFLSLDEEDKIFADKRESPRARPQNEKWVKVAKLKSTGPVLYKLFDLSRGGLGFLTENEKDFSVGTEVHIVGFNEFDLDDPFTGEVRSIRAASENFTEFKVGVKFSEEKD